MILNELVELAKRSSLPPVGCWERAVAATVEIDLDGKYRSCVFHKQAKNSQLPKFWFPFIQPTNSGKPSIGVHKLEHILGAKFSTKGSKSTRRVDRHDDKACEKKQGRLKEFSLWCAMRCNGNAQLKSWSQFLNDGSQVDALWKELAGKPNEHSLNSSDYIAIRLNGHSWWQDDSVVEFWKNEARDVSDAAPELKGKKRKLLTNGSSRAEIVDTATGQCLVCGTEQTEIERLVPSFDSLTMTKEGLKVVPDKLKFTSFNRAAYSSRLLHKSYNAPICKMCADRAAKAWNSLVSNPESRFLLDDQVLVFWGEIIVKSWEVKARDTKVWRELLATPIKGIAQRIGPQGIRVLGLGSHESSAFPTVWLKQDADRTARSILRWIRWQTILGVDQQRYFSLTELITAMRARKDKRRQGSRRLLDKHEARLWRDLLYVSYGEGRVPPYIVNRLVERLGTELETFRLDRLVLLNICLCSLNDLEVIDVNNLTERQKSAFNAGRIFNLICYAQREAIGETGKTLLASNARLAAVRPGYMLGELITRLHQVYLPKLRRDKTGLYIWIDTLVKGLVSETSFLEKHTPEEMGWFWKGFYASDLSEEYKRYQEKNKERRTQ